MPTLRARNPSRSIFTLVVQRVPRDLSLDTKWLSRWKLCAETPHRANLGACWELVDGYMCSRYIYTKLMARISRRPATTRR